MIVGVIPARFAATRFPGKPLAKILGKPLIEWVIRGSQQSKSLNELVVATDHDGIAEVARKCGVKAIMTDSRLPSGSDRVWDAIKSMPVAIAVNIQGDEPLISGELIDQLVKPFSGATDISITTMVKDLEPGELNSPQSVKVIVNKNNEAIYFSRLPVPFTRDTQNNLPKAALKHVGMYAYRKDFLRQFCECGPVDIEKAEGLEQLRALYLGAKIKTVRTTESAWGVDVPEDVAKVEKIMRDRGIK